MKNRRKRKAFGYHREDSSVAPNEKFTIFTCRLDAFDRIKLRNCDIVDFDLDILIRILENFQIKLNEI